MKIIILGTGTSQGVPVIGCTCAVCQSEDHRDKRTRVSAMIEYNDRTFLIDIGPDFRYQMLTTKKSVIDAVFITHEHNDHTAGLDDIRPINFSQKKNIPFYALPRVAHELKTRFSYAFGESNYPGAPKIELYTIDGNRFDVLGITIEPIHILHGSLPILGFRIGNMAYLTDIKTIPESEIKKMKNLDVLIISALRKWEHPTHLSLDQAIELAEKIGAKRTYFTHVSHSMGKFEDIDKGLPSGMSFAFDGLEILL